MDVVKRRLVAILAADMVGYSRLIQLNETGTISRQKSLRKQLIDPKFVQYGGRIVKTTGDGLLVEFQSVMDAVQCAADIQSEMAQRETDLPPESRIRYRVGINLGDIIIDGEDILGDGVNVACRIEGLATPGGICISLSVYDQIKDKTEIRLEDAGEHEVKNIKNPVRVYRVLGLGSTALSTVKANDEVTQNRRASIAVLPFDNLSEDSQLAFVADGLQEEILTGLQRFRLVSVISRNSSSRFRSRQVSAAQIFQDLKADYFIEGSIRKAAGFARVTLQLISSQNDQHLWAQRFDRSLDNPFDLQDEISAVVIAALEPILIDAEIKRGITLEPGLAHESKLKRATWHLYRFTENNCEQGIRLLEEAVKENPNASGRQEALAMGLMWRVTFGWVDDPVETVRQALAASKTAVDLAPEDAYKRAVRGWALVWGGNPGLAMSELERSVELSPQSAMTWGVLAWVAGHVGAADVAIKSIEKSFALNRDSPFVFQFATGASIGHFALKNWKQAAEFAETAALRRPKSLSSLVLLAASLRAQENFNKAASTYFALEELKPAMTEAWLRKFIAIQDTAVKDSIFLHLRELGLPAS
jgi:adenylate cyclase